MNTTEKSVEPKNKPIDTSGWEEVGADIDGFYKPETGSAVCGRVIEYFQMDNFNRDGRDDMVKIKLYEPAVGIQGSKEEAEETMLEVGAVLAVRCTAGLQPLLECVANKCAVKFWPTGKIKSRNNRPMWKYKVLVKGVRAPIPGVATPMPSQAAVPQSDDELPF